MFLLIAMPASSTKEPVATKWLEWPLRYATHLGITAKGPGLFFFITPRYHTIVSSCNLRVGFLRIYAQQLPLLCLSLFHVNRLSFLSGAWHLCHGAQVTLPCLPSSLVDETRRDESVEPPTSPPASLPNMGGFFLLVALCVCSERPHCLSY